MTPEVVVIDVHSVDLHDALVRFVPKVFAGASFREWYDGGGWEPGYRAFALFDGPDVIANVSVRQMSLVVQGVRLRGWQLGAVGVLPELRGRGLQHVLMPRVLAAIGASDPVFLYANDEVLDFYPKFGFRRALEWVFAVEHSIEPTASSLRRLSLDSDGDHRLLARIAADALPVTSQFGAERYGSGLLWHWANVHPHDFYYHANDDAIVVAEEDFEVLRICDVLASKPIELHAYLPQLVTRPTHHVEFGFTPERYWREARASCEYLESSLFVRGEMTLPTSEFKFPVLAQA